MKRIKVHYYHVVVPENSTPVVNTLRSLQEKNLEDRLKICGSHKVRLDEVTEHPRPDGQSFWHLKFSKFRDDNWPGVSASSQPAKDLELDDDESLSEETLVVYSPVKDRLVIQYNHYGVRASTVKEYLNLSISDPTKNYAVTPVLTNEALAKYEQKQIVTSIEASIEGVTEADIAFLHGSGLEEALAKSVEHRVTSFRFQFSVDARVKKNHVDRSWISRLVEGIKNRGGDSDSLCVTAKANEEDAVEVIDLLESRRMTEYNADLIDRTIGRRYDSAQLYGLLEQSMREWL
jgi:hypothetical protein